SYMALSDHVPFATAVLHLYVRGFGVLLATMAIGGVIGGVFSGRIVARFGARQVAIAAQFVCPLAWLAIGTVGRDPVTVVVLFAAFSMAISLWSVVALSVRQRLIPDALLGRVTSASRMFSYGAMPLGALAGGFVAKHFGLVAPWVLGGALSLCVTLLALPAMLRWEGGGGDDRLPHSDPARDPHGRPRRRAHAQRARRRQLRQGPRLRRPVRPDGPGRRRPLRPRLRGDRARPHRLRPLARPVRSGPRPDGPPRAGARRRPGPGRPSP